MVYEIDDVIPFSRRHRGETIRQIVRYDSGYIKHLIVKRSDFIISSSCYDELAQLTNGHKDNWVRPIHQTSIIFNGLKTYASPYLYDFKADMNSIRLINEQKLQSYKRCK